MKVGTFEPLVDLTDLYKALSELKTGGYVPSEAQQYLAFKIRQACQDLKKTATHVEARLKEIEGTLQLTPPPKKRRRKAQS